MTKQELLQNFADNHLQVVDYVNSLTREQFLFIYNEKWTAGQQLSHIHLTILPFVRVLPSKEFILERFGKIDRPTWSYDTVMENYLKTSRQAPQQYVPEQIDFDQKQEIVNGIEETLESIRQLFEPYTEEELDTLVIPHPLLGALTIREMFYLMSYHPIHHLKQMELNVAQLEN